MAIRFFITIGLFGLIIGSLGCAANPWAAPLLSRDSNTAEVESSKEKRGILDRRVNRSTVVRGAGVDPRARDIEKRLGFE